MNIKPWLVSTIYVASVTSRSSSGDPVYGTPVATLARVEKINRLMRLRDGTSAVVGHAVATEGEIARECRVWLPGDGSSDANKARRPLESYYATDKSGSTGYYETYF